MIRFLHTLVLLLAATFAVVLFLPDILLVAFVLAIGRTTGRGVEQSNSLFRGLAPHR